MSIDWIEGEFQTEAFRVEFIFGAESIEILEDIHFFVHEFLYKNL